MLTNRILEIIPYDDWIRASEIASKLGKRSIDIAWVITNKLLNKYVERKRIKENAYLYRRLKLISLPRKIKIKRAR